MIKVAFKKLPQKKQNGIYTKKGFIPIKGEYFYSPTDFKGVEGEVKFARSILVELLNSSKSQESLSEWVLSGLKRYLPFTSVKVFFSDPKVGESEVSIHFKVNDLEVSHPRVMC